MSEKPIIFTGESVRAILDGRKSQTRRVIKWPKDWQGFECDHTIPLKSDAGYSFWAKDSSSFDMACPYGVVGDKLWVKETWMLYNHMGTFVGNIPKHSPKDLSVGYKADELDRGNLFSWRSPIFMPKWAARIWLEITNIRVERVQEIDAVEAEAEGMRRPKRLCPDRHDEYILDRFIRYWNSLNAKRGFGWDKNPWVWVIEFKVISRNALKKVKK